MKNKTVTLKKPLSTEDIFDIADSMRADVIFTPEEAVIMSSLNEKAEPTRLFTWADSGNQTFSTIERSSVSDDLLVAALTRLPRKFAALKKEVIAGFELPRPAKKHRDLNKAQNEMMRQQRQDVEDATRDLPKVESIGTLAINLKKAIEVKQGFMEVLKPQDEQELLYTTGVGPCIVVAMVNRKDHTIGLAHMDSAAKHPKLSDMQKQVQTHSQDPVDVMLWGGRKDDSEPLASVLMKYIREQPGLTLKSVDVCDPARRETRLDSMVLSRNGDIRLVKSSLIEALASPDIMQAAVESIMGKPRKRISIRPGSPDLEPKDRGRGKAKGNQDG